GAAELSASQHVTNEERVTPCGRQNQDPVLDMFDGSRHGLPTSNNASAPLYSGAPVNTPLKSRSGLPMRSPDAPTLSSRMVRSWAPVRFLITEMACRIAPAASKYCSRMTVSAR